jgi:hypothetical protein
MKAIQYVNEFPDKLAAYHRNPDFLGHSEEDLVFAVGLDICLRLIGELAALNESRGSSSSTTLANIREITDKWKAIHTRLKNPHLTTDLFTRVLEKEIPSVNLLKIQMAGRVTRRY